MMEWKLEIFRNSGLNKFLQLFINLKYFRLFHSIKGTWELCSNDTADVRELIPEFFYLPDFLINKSNINFGRKFNTEEVSDVKLPKWAKSPEEFIIKHREALESPIVK